MQGAHKKEESKQIVHKLVYTLFANTPVHDDELIYTIHNIISLMMYTFF